MANLLTEVAMPSVSLWNRSVPRAELDKRARDARLELERMERLLVARAAANDAGLRWVFRLFGFRRYRTGPQVRRPGDPLTNQRPPRMPQIPKVWLERSGLSYRAARCPISYSPLIYTGLSPQNQKEAGCKGGFAEVLVIKRRA
jgi:hypothetical protein